MASVKGYPGIGLGTVEYYYMRNRVQKHLEMPKEGVHSVYDCTDVTTGMKCDYKITIMNAQHVVIIQICFDFTEFTTATTILQSNPPGPGQVSLVHGERLPQTQASR
jgi:hypothetical protein